MFLGKVERKRVKHKQFIFTINISIHIFRKDANITIEWQMLETFPLKTCLCVTILWNLIETLVLDPLYSNAKKRLNVSK